MVHNLGAIMKKLLILLTLISFPACAQVLDTSKLEAKLAAQDVINQAVSEEIAGLIKRIEALETVPLPAAEYPFNVTNAKLTYPDATETNYPDFLTKQTPYFTVEADGSFRYKLPADVIGTTPNAKYSRIEHRFYKDLKAKTNWKFDEALGDKFGVVFNQLHATERGVFAQIHGMSTKPYFKAAAGKGTIALLMGLTETATTDTILDFKVKPVLGKKYIFEYKHQGTTLTASLYNEDGTLIASVKTDKFTRKDDKYSKAGAYGPGPLDIQFFKVK